MRQVRRYKLYKVSECVKAWGIHKRTVERMMKRGLGTKINGIWYTTKARVLELSVDLADLL